MHIPNAVIIVFRQISRTGDQPGDLNSCMSLVQDVLPIALARPFVERFIPKGTRVSILFMILKLLLTDKTWSIIIIESHIIDKVYMHTFIIGLN